MATITIDIFDPKSIEKAANKINLLAVAVDHVKDLPTKDVANIGLETANVAFASADTAPWYGEDPVIVSLQETEKGYCICATGEQVAFIEYGAGVHVNGISDTENRPSWVVPWGEYGKKKGRNPKWSYMGKNGKIRTTAGIMARQGMYFALKDMEDAGHRILKKYIEAYTGTF